MSIIPEVVLKDSKLTVSKDITGISVQNERGSDKIVVWFFEGDYAKHMLVMNVEAARMLRTALQTMTILDEVSEADDTVRK